MNEHNDQELRAALRSAIARLEDPELKRDLWPRMLRRLDQSPIRASWLDWALAVLLLVWLAVFPEAIPVLLYHL
jgi:hypothetical protein